MILDMVIGDGLIDYRSTLSEARRMMGSYLLYRLDVTAHQSTQYLGIYIKVTHIFKVDFHKRYN
jgi:hypothetical protein